MKEKGGEREEEWVGRGRVGVTLKKVPPRSFWRVACCSNSGLDISQCCFTWRGGGARLRMVLKEKIKKIKKNNNRKINGKK